MSFVCQSEAERSKHTTSAVRLRSYREGDEDKSPSLYPRPSPASCGAGRAAATPPSAAQVHGPRGCGGAAACSPRRGRPGRRQRPALDLGLPPGRGTAGAGGTFASATAATAPCRRGAATPQSQAATAASVAPPPTSPLGPEGLPAAALRLPVHHGSAGGGKPDTPASAAAPGAPPFGTRRPGLPARRSSSIATANCAASQDSSAVGTAASGCPQRAREPSALSRDPAERRVMGGGGGGRRGPARTQVGGCPR